MMLMDRDANTSGRNSRASDLSAASRGPSRGSATAARQDMLSANPAVASMLRNSTEMGNLGGFSADPVMPNVPRVSRRGGASSRLSIASSRSNTSNRTPAHQHWHSTASAGTRHSRESNMPQYVPDTLSPTVMNITGSSPLIPLARDHRDAHRSLSMSLANSSEPTFRLTNNRSLASLRSHDQLQRPKSPYMYPTRLRRPGYRPSSPALSDTGGAYPRRRHGYSDHGFPPYPGQVRLRRPSEISMRRPPSRSRTPVYYGDPHPDIPPVPPLIPHRHAALERERKSQKSHRSASHRSGKHSISSGSTNRRTDSDIPSSDSTSPPTPRDGDILLSRSGTRSMARSMSGTVNYYDYSEQYEGQDAVEPQAGSVPTGFVRHIKTIIEERGTPEPATKANNIASDKPNGIDGMVPNIPELPASPVPRRITRDLVLAGIGPESSSGEIETSEAPAEARSSEQLVGNSHKERVTTHADVESGALYPANTLDAVKNRHSILSQAGSSVMDSSTLEFAVRCSIPMVADKGVTLETDEDTEPAYGPDADPTSEDGMTDLIEGYQRTDTKDNYEEVADTEDGDDEPAEKRSNHAAKPSDEQSFKSCTDLIDATVRPAKEPDARSFKSCENLADPDPPFKDSDAKSFKTCKDAVTPDRVASLPASRLPSSNVITSESAIRRPFSDMPSPSPLVSDRRVPPSSTSESSMSRVVGRFRANSKLSSTQGSATGSFASFKEQVPPAVPPRESSSSKEAQHSRGVANFLLRSVRQRFTKASPGSNLRPGKEVAVAKSELHDIDVEAEIPTPPRLKERTLAENMNASIDRPSAPPKALEHVLAKEQTVPHRKGETVTIRGSSVAPKEETPKMSVSVATTSNLRKLSFNTPSPILPEASSVYSPDNISSALSSSHTPVALPQTPEQHRRDSQTTTHLSWHGGNSVHPGSVERPPAVLGNGQENLIADLKIPGLRHAPNHHLPDLKEESHEDSSLNTSASNFHPFGGSQPAVFRASTDGAPASRRHASVKSSRNSVLQQMHLPSMNFSSFGSFDDALDHRVSRSLDLAPATREELSQIIAMPRSASAGEDREKYKSVFAGLDTPAKTPGIRQHPSIDLLMRKSPETFIKEVDSLTIPSVNGLTTRLSEMLPKLKEALGLAQDEEFPDEEGIMEKAMEKLNEVGPPSSKRSSARLRPLPGSPSMLVVDDEVFKEITAKEKLNTCTARSVDQLSSAPGAKLSAQGDSQARAGATALVGSNVAAHGRARDATGIHTAEPEKRTTAHLRYDDSTFFPRLFPTPSKPSSSRSSPCSTPTPTPTETRPWNIDKNYPWAADSSVDISLPTPSAPKQSPHPGPSHLRHRLSSASSDSVGSTSQLGTLASPPARRGPTGHCSSFVVGEKPSLDPSAVGFDASGYPIGPLRVRDDDQSHGAGDRYPTSALPLPSNLHIYPGQECHFSLDTDDDEPEIASPRKTLFARRARRSTRAAANRPQVDPVSSQELERSRTTNCSVQSQVDEVPDRSRRHTFANAKGMSRLAYIANKVVLSVKKGAGKVRDLLCCPRPSSPTESDSTDVTVPANSRANSPTEEDQVLNPENRTVPPIRDGPGPEYSPGYFISFPLFDDHAHGHAHGGQPSSFESNITPQRNYGSIASPATDTRAPCTDLPASL